MKFERLDRKIKLRKLKQTIHEESGEAIKELDYEIRTRAEFKPLRGSDIFESSRDVSRGQGSFVIRYREEVESHFWEIEDWKGRIWDIMGEPIVIGMREALEIPAELRQ